jgi:polysaccharide chain length determinant protein (PEP-CTERM system associated)
MWGGAAGPRDENRKMTTVAPEESGIERVREIWSRRKWWAIATFAAVLCVAGSFVVFLPDIYRATVTVLVDRPPVPENVVQPAASEEVNTRLRTIGREILSRDRLSELIEQHDLYPRERATVPREQLVDRLRRDIEFETQEVKEQWGRDATIAFALSYRGRDPLKVAEVANALAGFYVTEDLAARGERASRIASFLKIQLADLEAKLDDQERNVREFKERYSDELPEQQDVNLARIERLSSQLQANRAAQTRVKEVQETLARQVAQRDPGAAGAPGEETIAGRIAALERRLAELLVRYHEEYPDVVRLRAEIEALQRLPDPPREEVAPAAPRGTPPRDALSGAQRELRDLEREEARLRAELEAHERRVDYAPRRQQELEELSRGYETTHELYRSLLKRYQEALVSENLERGNTAERFHILDAALPPASPAAPNRPWLMLMGLIAALGSGAAAAGLAEQLDTRFNSVTDLRRFTHVPVLACVPRIVTPADRRRWRLRISGAIASAVVGLALLAGAAAYAARTFGQIAWFFTRIRM